MGICDPLLKEVETDQAIEEPAEMMHINQDRERLSPQLILEGLTDGMPTSIKQLMTVNPPTSPTEWLMVATRLNETQAPKPEQNTFRQNVPIQATKTKILLYLKTATLFDPTSKILIECFPNISQISMLITLTIESSENSVSSQQIPNQRQHPSTEASCPAYWQLQVSGHISSLPSLANLDNLPKHNNVNIVIDTGSTLSLISADIVNKLRLQKQKTRPIQINHKPMAIFN
ncbi:uncharacterized protein TNCV_3205921 [Trichonephila clavipes]|nr:uncharacterized protein TNCV_3205921 [Trichonephila clavipes]